MIQQTNMSSGLEMGRVFSYVIQKRGEISSSAKGRLFNGIWWVPLDNARKTMSPLPLTIGRLGLISTSWRSFEIFFLVIWLTLTEQENFFAQEKFEIDAVQRTKDVKDTEIYSNDRFLSSIDVLMDFQVMQSTLVERAEHLRAREEM